MNKGGRRFPAASRPKSSRPVAGFFGATGRVTQIVSKGSVMGPLAKARRFNILCNSLILLVSAAGIEHVFSIFVAERSGLLGRRERHCRRAESGAGFGSPGILP